MILVMLGTQDKSFHRLLDAIEKEINSGSIKEKVVVQAGYTKYKSNNMKVFDLIPQEELDDLVNSASVIITHAGVGSIINGLKKGKKVIAAARLQKYNEHTNDHQLQILKNFSEKKYILPLYDFDKLGDTLLKVADFEPEKYVSNTQNMIQIIENYINEL